MKILDDRDEFIDREAEKAAKGLAFAILPQLGHGVLMEALNVEGFHERWRLQVQRATQVLVQKPVQKPVAASTLGPNIGFTRLAALSSRKADKEPEQNTQTPEEQQPKLPAPGVSLLKSLSTLGISAADDKPAHPPTKSADKDKAQRGRSTAVNRGGVHGSRYEPGRGGLRSARGGAQGDPAKSEASQAQNGAQAPNKFTPRYPMVWSRWLKCDEATFRVVQVGDKTFRIEKLDPKVYGDAHHDLGFCKAHMTKGMSCALGWEQCPYRHWEPEQIEEPWINRKWLKSIRDLDRGPRMPPDAPHTRYEGRARHFYNGGSFSSSRKANTSLEDAQVPLSSAWVDPDVAKTQPMNGAASAFIPGQKQARHPATGTGDWAEEEPDDAQDAQVPGAKTEANEKSSRAQRRGGGRGRGRGRAGFSTGS